jgi:hypothetical protein
MPQIPHKKYYSRRRGGFSYIWGKFNVGCRRFSISDNAAIAMTAALSLFLLNETAPGEKSASLGRQKCILSACISIALFSAPLAPFFVLSNNWLYLRNLFLPLVGLSMLCGIGWSTLSKQRFAKAFGCLIAAIAILVSFAGNIGEVRHYKSVEENNLAIGQRIIDKINEHGAAHRLVWLFGARYGYGGMQIAHFVSSVTYDWPLTGVVESMTATTHLPIPNFYINPIIANTEYNMSFDPSLDILLGIDENLSVRNLRYDGNELIWEDTGEVFGLVEKGENRVFTRLEAS